MGLYSRQRNVLVRRRLYSRLRGNLLPETSTDTPLRLHHVRHQGLLQWLNMVGTADVDDAGVS